MTDSSITDPLRDEPPAPDMPPSTHELHFRVEVIRSARRRRTVDARLVGDVLSVRIPNWMSAGEEAAWVEKMSAGFRRKMSADRIDLVSRSGVLADRHGLPRPVSIAWSDTMTARWGSCSTTARTIAISTRVARFPDWVVDAVIFHELCHLVEPYHDDAFWTLAHRFPLMERSIGYLIAKSGDHDPAFD